MLTLSLLAPTPSSCLVTDCSFDCSSTLHLSADLWATQKFHSFFWLSCNIQKHHPFAAFRSSPVLNAFIPTEWNVSAYLHLDLMKPNEHNNDDETTLAAKLTECLLCGRCYSKIITSPHHSVREVLLFRSLLVRKLVCGEAQSLVQGDTELGKESRQLHLGLWS